jgi:hypothetical protein
MNNTRIPFGSYDYNYTQAQYRNLSAMRGQKPMYSRPKNSQMSSGEVSKKIVSIVIGILIVLILGWLGLNFLLYEKDSAWFKVYTPPPPPSDSIQPNGNGSGGKLDDATNTYKNQQLGLYQAGNPSKNASDFGGYITTPPPPQP